MPFFYADVKILEKRSKGNRGSHPHRDVFDDAATGQGLLNYFLRGMNCKAITEEEALATGLTLDELCSRSFVRILNGRALNSEWSEESLSFFDCDTVGI